MKLVTIRKSNPLQHKIYLLNKNWFMHRIDLNQLNLIILPFKVILHQLKKEFLKIKDNNT